MIRQAVCKGIVSVNGRTRNRTSPKAKIAISAALVNKLITRICTEVSPDLFVATKTNKSPKRPNCEKRPGGALYNHIKGSCGEYRGSVSKFDGFIWVERLDGLLRFKTMLMENYSLPIGNLIAPFSHRWLNLQIRCQLFVYWVVVKDKKVTSGTFLIGFY